MVQWTLGLVQLLLRPVRLTEEIHWLDITGASLKTSIRAFIVCLLLVAVGFVASASAFDEITCMLVLTCIKIRTDDRAKNSIYKELLRLIT